MREKTNKQKIFLILFGILLTFALLEIGLRLGGFLLSSNRFNNRIDYNNETYVVLCLGESTTAKLPGENSWPEELEISLNQRNKKIKFQVVNEGLIGVTSTYIISHIEENLVRYKPDMVITMMGINDNDPYVRYEKGFFENLRTLELFRLLKSHLESKIKDLDDKKQEVLVNKEISYYNSSTYNNYQTLYNILNERKVKLVIMQYPMRNVKEFKNMFDEEQQQNVIFVSNEENFKKALENASYDDYFTDHFAGDFGHCTLKGNMLIAENVADVVLNELNAVY